MRTQTLIALTLLLPGLPGSWAAAAVSDFASEVSAGNCVDQTCRTLCSLLGLQEICSEKCLTQWDEVAEFLQVDGARACSARESIPFKFYVTTKPHGHLVKDMLEVPQIPQTCKWHEICGDLCFYGLASGELCEDRCGSQRSSIESLFVNVTHCMREVQPEALVEAISDNTHPHPGHDSDRHRREVLRAKKRLALRKSKMRIRKFKLKLRELKRRRWQKARPRNSWTVLLGTPQSEDGRACTSDKNDNIYVVGRSDGNLSADHLGSSDGYVAKFNRKGQMYWIAGISTTLFDLPLTVAVARDGHVLVGGILNSMPAYPKDYDSFHGFVAKLSPEGEQVWLTSIATPAMDVVTGVAVTDEGIYVCGSLGGPASNIPSPIQWRAGAPDNTTAQFGRKDAFMARMTHDGHFAWTRVIGSAGDDACFGILVDGHGDIVVAGVLEQDYKNLRGPKDIYQHTPFLSKISADGSEVWTTVLESSSITYANAVAQDGKGNLYISGTTMANLTGQQDRKGDMDAYVAKFTEKGEQVWVRSIASTGIDASQSLAGAEDHVYVAGWTSHSSNNTRKSFYDGFVTRVSEDGTVDWTKYVASDQQDEIWGIAPLRRLPPHMDDVYVCGYTEGNLSSQVNQGGPQRNPSDAFLMRLP